MVAARTPTETGKLAELRLVSALINRRFCAFMPVVDLGIDIVAEKIANIYAQRPPKYYAFQVKNSTFRKNHTWNWYVSKDSFRCAKNLYYVFVFEEQNRLPVEAKPEPDFNACIIPSKEIDRHGHWTPYDSGFSFDVTISINMLKNISKWSKKPSNSGMALRHFNDWKI
jgi:hypothetical protein